jgi:hypothetical protein
MATRSPARDLPAELYDALKARGIRLFLYFCSDPCWNDEACRKVLTQSGRTDMNATHYSNVCAIMQEWSDRYGSKITGWWIDGWWDVGFGKARDDGTLARNFAKALKHGNPNTLIAFNQGIGCIADPTPVSVTDYTAGEARDLTAVCHGRWVDGLQWHILTFLGKDWNRDGLSNTTSDLLKFVRDNTSNGGAVTLDIQVFRDGSWNAEQFNQMKAMKDLLRGSKRGKSVKNSDTAIVRKTRRISKDLKEASSESTAWNEPSVTWALMSTTS